jgi:uncharacterized SAM-binding protein YcdF (DUF218 family)
MYLLSKVFWAVAQPGNLLLFVLAAALACLCMRRPIVRRTGRRLVGLVLVSGLVIAVVPLGTFVAAPLQNRFPGAGGSLDRVDGIVVLGGGIDIAASLVTGRTELTGAGDRLLAAAALARRYPEARLVYASGGRALDDPQYREADAAFMALAALGVEEHRIIVERDSRNTHENAVFARDLARPAPGEVWLLVTSAWHMPRAMGAFRHVGWRIRPYPVDAMVAEGWDIPRFAFAANLNDLNVAIKEWVGLVAYRLAGWTDSFFPGPEG